MPNEENSVGRMKFEEWWKTYWMTKMSTMYPLEKDVRAIWDGGQRERTLEIIALLEPIQKEECDCEECMLDRGIKKIRKKYLEGK